ncbi:hypothetical protein WR25_15309 [Diploscapter pachys]|uniref:Uncharacterized protein n=1 Tax=Diploscapter pachys TaxID=2018661 RepID=A0A2A2K9Q4_9BILA|nr:hypothetical protein WR25_15309 [Diploscapter pachys]
MTRAVAAAATDQMIRDDSATGMRGLSSRKGSEGEGLARRWHRWQRRAQAEGRGQCAKADIEAPAALGEVPDHYREQCPEQSGADAIEQLHGHQPKRIVRHHVEHATQRQDQEADEQQRFASPAVGPGAGQQRHGHHHQLRRDDARRGQRRGQLQVGLSQFLAHQRKHCRVGQMEQRAAHGEQ